MPTVASPQAVTEPPRFTAPTSAAGLYTAALTARRESALRLHRRHLLLGYLRLLWFAAIVALAYLGFASHRLSWEWLLVPCLGFAISARWHSRVLGARGRNLRAQRYYEHGLARLEDRWAGLRPRTTPAAVADSLYAADLDLFGPGSLFELLCTTRTSLGEGTLAGWLLAPAPPLEVLERQASVRELRDRTALREHFSSVSGPDLVAVDAASLAVWGEAQEPALPKLLTWIAPLLVVLVLAAVARWTLTQSPVLLLPLLAVNFVLTLLMESRLKPLFAETQDAHARLAALAELFQALEQEPFSAPRLIALQAQLRRGRSSASQAIRGLARLARAVEQRSNGIVRMLDLVLLPSVHLGLLVQRWRCVHGGHLRPWLQALGEMEALLALSAYHFEHPADVFPELVPEPVFLAEALGHPLLPEAQCVRNHVTLDPQTRLLLVSGSNMSGKSTLLRSVGVAAVLAAAGAPVRAGRLRLGPLRVAASIQVNDSLQSGRSRFYAEILRLRAVCELARTHPPVLFLLDELLAGTNSQDRVTGTTGIVQALLRAGALGLLSTHDLALTEISDLTAGSVHNVHFEDRIQDDRLHFDYTLREGVVTRRNGLALMRLMGLDV